MKAEILAPLSGMVSASRVFVILLFWNIDLVSEYSIIYALLNILTIGSAILNNQYLNHKGIFSNHKSRYIYLGLNVSILNLLVIGGVYLAFGIDNIPFFLVAIYISSYFVEYSLTIHKQILLVYSLRIATSVIFITSLFVNNGDMLTALYLQYTIYLFASVYYVILVLKSKNSLKSQYKLSVITFKRTGVLYFTPIINAFLDYAIKITLMKSDLNVVLGTYQILQSIENLIGQVFGSPYLKLQLIRNVKKSAGFIYNYSKMVFKYLLMMSFSLFFLSSISFFGLEIINQKINSLDVNLYFLCLLIIFRGAPLIWASVGQRLIVLNNTLSVFVSETMLRVIPFIVVLINPAEFNQIYIYLMLLYFLPLVILKKKYE